MSDGKVEAGIMALKASEESKLLAVQCAELQAVKSNAVDLKQSYKDGLRDGASLSSGKGVTSADSPYTPNL